MQKAKQANFQPFNASAWRIGIVVAQFNQDITDELHQNALAQAANYDIPPENINSVKVAGSVEIPLALQQMAKSGRYKALLAIGCIVRGETPHFGYVCKFVTEGVLRVQLDEKIPIGFGVLTCNTKKQAEARAHLGGEFLDAVLHQAKTIDQIHSAGA